MGIIRLDHWDEDLAALGDVVIVGGDPDLHHRAEGREWRPMIYVADRKDVEAVRALRAKQSGHCGGQVDALPPEAVRP